MSEGALGERLRARYGDLVERVLRRMGGPEAREVFAKVERGDAQLFDAGGGVIVTQVLREREELVCQIWMAAGELEPLLRRHDDVCAWARSIGCTKMRITGRRGWTRVLPGYRETAVVVERALGGSGAG